MAISLVWKSIRNWDRVWNWKKNPHMAWIDAEMMRTLVDTADVPFQSHVCVDRTRRILYPKGAKNGQIRSIYIQLQVVRQATVEFEIGSILLNIRKLSRLKSIKFIEKLKVQLPSFGNCGIVCVERQLPEQRCFTLQIPYNASRHICLGKSMKVSSPLYLHVPGMIMNGTLKPCLVLA